MSCRSSICCIGLVASALVTLPADASPERSLHHTRHRAEASRFRRVARHVGPADGFARTPVPQAFGGYYGASGWEAEVNARLTAQAYREPGVTLELAPDAKQTATGGPSGGVPGFSGF